MIELLVVITIIGLLAGILIPAVTGALKGAKRARAMRQLQDLDGAVKRFFAEYGRMPVPAGDNGGPDKVYSGSEQAKVIEILINQSPDPTVNPKEIVFLDLDPASFGVKTVNEMLALLAGGTPYKGPFNSEFDETEYRPRDYFILMDLNYDDKITGLTISQVTNDISNIRAKAAVFSWGLQPRNDKQESTYQWKPLWTW